MYQDALKRNAYGILDQKKLFWLFAIMGHIKLKWAQSEIRIQTKRLESRFQLCGFAWK